MKNLLHKRLELEDQDCQAKLSKSEASVTMNSALTRDHLQAGRIMYLLEEIGPDKNVAELLRILAAKVDPIE